jgi:hypothetical protein
VLSARAGAAVAGVCLALALPGPACASQTRQAPAPPAPLTTAPWTPVAGAPAALAPIDFPPGARAATSGPPGPAEVPPAAVPGTLPTSFSGIPGTAERQCVQVGRTRSVRSGEFVVGDFPGFIDGWRQEPRQHKLFWIPLHQGLLGSPGHPVATATVWSVSLRGGPFYGEVLTEVASGSDLFFPDGPSLPSRGPWRLIGVSGPDWGCFDLTL